MLFPKKPTTVIVWVALPAWSLTVIVSPAFKFHGLLRRWSWSRTLFVLASSAVRGIDHSKVEGQRLGDQVVEAGSNVLAEDEHQTHRENSDEQCDQCGRRSS